MLIALLILSSLLRVSGVTPPPATTPPAEPEQPLAVPALGEDAAPPVTDPLDDEDESPKRRPPVGLLTPITENGGLPLIYNKLYDLTAEELAYRARMRQYAQQIRKIRAEHFGDVRVAAIRQNGIELLQEFTDAAAFRPMIQELRREQDDVRLAVLDHFAKQGNEGQAALGWVAIYDKDPAIQNEALNRMTAPAGEPVKYLLNSALRAEDHGVVSAAAIVAGALNVVEAIPLLIFAQAAVSSASESQGDLAWIAIQTQHAFVAGLQPVVGSNVGAFQPIIGIVSEGVVMRVVDAVVIEYRTPVHSSLVAMTTGDWGESTAELGYNVQAWWDWYNTKYVPFKNEQALTAALAEEPKPEP